MATHSSILAWRIPWTEEADGLQSMGSQRVAHELSMHTHVAFATNVIRCFLNIYWSKCDSFHVCCVWVSFVFANLFSADMLIVKLQQERFRVEVRKNSFTVRGITCWKASQILSKVSSGTTLAEAPWEVPMAFSVCPPSWERQLEIWEYPRDSSWRNCQPLKMRPEAAGVGDHLWMWGGGWEGLTKGVELEEGRSRGRKRVGN